MREWRCQFICVWLFSKRLKNDRLCLVGICQAIWLKKRLFRVFLSWSKRVLNVSLPLWLITLYNYNATLQRNENANWVTVMVLPMGTTHLIVPSRLGNHITGVSRATPRSSRDAARGGASCVHRHTFAKWGISESEAVGFVLHVRQWFWAGGIMGIIYYVYLRYVPREVLADGGTKRYPWLLYSKEFRTTAKSRR